MSNPLIAVPMQAARWSAEHPWRAILLWIAAVSASVGLAMMVSTVEAEDADYRIGDSGRADVMVTDAGLDTPPSENVLIRSDQGALDPAAAESAAAAIRTGALATDGVTDVSEGVWSEDRSAMLLSIQLARDQDDTSALSAATEVVAAAYPDLDIRQAGDATLDESINDRVADDLHAAELTSIPLTLVLMLVAFGALIAAGIPVLLAVGSVAATVGIMAPLSHLVPAETTVTSMIVLIGMAVGVDYSLFYLKRQREEQAAGHSTIDAVEIAAATSGHSILVSGGAVIAAMTGLFVVGGATFNSLAAGSILVVTVAVLGSITLLPALLVKLGHWADRPRVPGLWRLNRRIGRGGISNRILAPVVRHPVIALVVSTLVVIGLSLPAFGMRIQSSSLDTLPASIPQVATMRAITDQFPAEGVAVGLVARASADEQGAVADALEEARLQAVGDGLVPDAAPDVRVSDDGTVTVMRLALGAADATEQTDRTIRDLRDQVLPEHLTGVADEYAVGGGDAEALDTVTRLRDRMPLVIGWVLLLTLLIMGLTFRSGPIAIVSALLNLASVGVAFGFITLVFQHGWGESLLDFTSPGYVIDWLPLFVLVVLIGLSMDYHVFVVSRIREYVDAGFTTRAAVQRGVADTAGVVTSAAAVMVAVFSLFATLSLMEMKTMGVGLSVAILLDATLVRLVMLPAALVLLGDRAWWPRRPGAARDTALDQPEVRDLEPTVL